MSFRITQLLIFTVPPCVLMAWCMAWCVICSGTASAEPVVFRDLLHLVCSTHPLVSGRLADVDAAKLGRSSARMQFLPTPSVSTVRLDGRAATITGMNQPLWTGGRLTAGLDNANLKVELAQTGLSDSTQSLAMRTIGAYQQFVAQRDKRDSQRRNLQRLTDLGAMIERRVQQGLSAASDVSLARTRLAQARADLAVVDAQLQLALSQLGILAGRTFTEADIQLETVPSVPPERTLDEWVTEVEAIDPSLQAARLQVLIADKEAEMAASSLWPMVSLRAEHQAGYYTGAQLPGDRVSLVLNYAPGAGWSAGVERDAARARARALREGVETARRDLRERIAPRRRGMSGRPLRSGVSGDATNR